MKKSVTLLLVLILTVSCLITLKPGLSSAVSTEDSWLSKALMHQARGLLGVAVVDERIYAIGGDIGRVTGNAIGEFIVTGSVSNANEEYDPTTDMWAFKAPMPTARASFGVAVYLNKIYCIGGYANGGETAVNEVYDPEKDTWEIKAPMPTARKMLTANVVNGKIYVIGALDRNSPNDVYDPIADSWAKGTPPPYEIMSCASAVFDNKIYFLATDYNFDSQGHVLSAKTPFVMIYNPENNNWSIGPSSPTYGITAAASLTSGVSAPKRIYFFEEAATYVYDPVEGNWTVGAPMLTGRVCAGVGVINDVFHVVGGRTGSHGYIVLMEPSALNEQYIPTGYRAIPPKVSVASPENRNYTSSEVALNFTVNRQTEWMGYSLDGSENVTVTGSTTLMGLSSGLHNVTVYVKDEFGNTGASETVSFTVAAAPFPVVPVAAASVAVVAVIGVALLVYFKKRKR